jgi:catechol 2,3-dioxygenase-like lactoylglutathione lyase family enzyme
MLAESVIMAFAATADAGQAREFYCGKLGLHEIEDSPFALVLSGGGTTLRVQKVAQVSPPPYTVLGWEVADIAATMRELAQRGIRFARFDGLPQDDNGLWTAPDGTRVAWFRDPDGNLLSLSEERSPCPDTGY